MATVVIGAGLAGLSAALTLQEAGEEVELIDASDGVGGRVRSDFIDGYILDRGFQLINAGYPEIKRLGVIGEIDFQVLDRTVDVLTPFGITSIGDPRLHPVKALRSPLGSLAEKVAILNFIGAKSIEGNNLEEALLASGAGEFYHNLLRPFLTGVFLIEPSQVEKYYGREIIRSFVLGKSGLPKAGVGTLSEALAARVERVQLSTPVTSLDEFVGKHVIIATDAFTADSLVSTTEERAFASSTTWYHSVPEGEISASRLRVSSAQTPIVNSIAISNFIPEYAPDGRTLISTTSITALTETQVLDEISKFWRISAREFELVKRYEIKNSLPIFSTGTSPKAGSAKVRDGLYRAGDYMSAGSQNGALLSGRLAAMELLLDQGR